MDISKVKDVLRKYPEQPKLLIGPPGIGKTQVVREFAEEVRRKLYTIVLSHLDIDDLKGIPYITPEGKLEIKRGPLIPGEDEEAVVFLDELTTVSQQKLAIALKILDEKCVGYFKFPKAYVIAAGNPPEWRGLTLDERVTSRCVVYDVGTSVEGFTDYVIKKFQNRPIVEVILAFLNFDRRMLLEQPKVIGQVFPTPRGWEKVIRMNSEFDRRDELIEALKDDKGMVLETVVGCVGKAVGTQLVNFTKVYDKLPAIEKVLKGEEVTVKIDELNISYAVVVALGLKVENQKQVGYVMNFIDKNIKGQDFLVLAAKIIYTRGFRLGEWIRKIDVMNLI